MQDQSVWLGIMAMMHRRIKRAADVNVPDP
jgi:hypothetical protein